MKKLMYVSVLALFLFACNSSSDNDNKTTTGEPAATASAGQAEDANANPSYDPKRGEGKFTHVEISSTLDKEKAEAGEKIYNVKCSACHKLTDEKLVGPDGKA